MDEIGCLGMVELGTQVFASIEYIIVVKCFQAIGSILVKINADPIVQAELPAIDEVVVGIKPSVESFFLVFRVEILRFKCLVRPSVWVKRLDDQAVQAPYFNRVNGCIPVHGLSPNVPFHRRQIRQADARYHISPNE